MKTRTRFLLKLSFILLPILLVLSLAACGECEHEWGEWTVKTAPSCESAGARTRTCALCEETQEEAVAALGHEFLTYASNNDAKCNQNATESAACTRCAATDTREIADSKNPALHASTETRFQKSGTDSEKHDKIHSCCSAIIETVAHGWDNGTPDPNEPGVTVYTCADCGATKKLGGAGHTHAATKMNANDAGCTSFGNIEYWYCAGCDTCFADAALTNAIPEESTRIPPSHTGGTATCNAQAICSRCREPYGTTDPNNHNSAAGSFYEQHATDKTKHNKKYACCGALIETSGHNNDGGRVDGTVTVYTCQNCRYETRVPIAGHVHTSTHVPAKAETCTTAGNLEHWYCPSCQKYFSNEAMTNEVTEQSVTIPATHSSDEFTYTVNATDPTKHDKKHACCGTLAATVAHEFELSRSYAATCAENGYNVYVCACGEDEIEYTTPANGHSVDAWTLSESPKAGVPCAFVQTWTGVCFTCREEVERVSETVRHTYAATVTLSPTCQTEGQKSYACACGAVPTPATATIPEDPNAHAWDDGVTENGLTTYTCRSCQANKTAIVSQAPTETLDKSELEQNEVVLNGGISLKLDNTLLGNLEGGDVTVTADPVEGSVRDALIAALPEDLRGQINANTTIMDFALVQNGRNVDFDGGKIHITMKYDLPTGADADRVAIWYVDDHNALSYYEARYYEVDGQGYVSFDAEHFSTYLPGIAPAENACVLYGHNYDTLVVAPTCSSRGYTEYHCQRCGESKIDDVLYALGHAYEITELTPSTCLATGSRTQICTREGCDYENTMTLPLASHRYQYDSEKSTQVTCTQDGVSVYSCTVQGCGAVREKEEGYRIPAWGHLNFRPVSATLAPGATKCTEGVVVTYQCGNDDYSTGIYGIRCTYTETKTVYEHINEYDFADNKENFQYDTREPQRIMLGSYLTAAGISYREEPYLEIAAGCLCGEQRGEIRIIDGTNQNGDPLFGFGGVDTVFRANEVPNPNNSDHLEEGLSKLTYTATSFTWDPENGPREFSWNICFAQKLAKDGCNYRYTVEIGYGYDFNTETAATTQEILLATYQIHVNPTETITLDDPSKTCYANCNPNNEFCYGIHVTRACADCGEVTEQFDDAVNTSSSHYYYSDVEIYEGPNGFRAYIRTCPCGAVRVDRGHMNHYGGEDYAGVRSVVSGEYNFRSTQESITGGTRITYTGTYGEETFIYVVERLTIYEDCQMIYTDILYLGCTDAQNYKTTYDKMVDCGRIAVYEHHLETTTNVDTPIAGYPCCINRVTTVACNNCTRTNSYQSVLFDHEPATTTVTDTKGNVTVTSYCETCGYLSIEVKNASGELIRRYSESARGCEELMIPEDIIYDGQMLWEVHITIYEEIDGVLRITLERMEFYEDKTKENCIAWGEQILQYRFESNTENGCILYQCESVSNSLGQFEYNEYEMSMCIYGEVESQEATCQQEGWQRQTCQICSHIDYIIYPYYGDHDIWRNEPEVQQATCQQEGWTKRTCCYCDYFEYDEPPHFGDHDIWKNEPEFQQATCQQEGWTKRTCCYCDYFEYDEPPHFGDHDIWQNEPEVQQATCQQEGWTKRTCCYCDYFEYDEPPHFGDHDIWSGEVETQERTCLQAGFERYHCAYCDYYEEPWYEESWGHMWTYGYSVMTTNGETVSFVRCDACGAHSKEGAPGQSATDVMLVGMEEGTVKVIYLNRNYPEGTLIDASCELVIFRMGMDEWGTLALLVDEDGNPETETLEDVEITDADGALTFSENAVNEAISGREDIAAVCLVVTGLDGSVTYLPIVQFLF